MRYAVLSDVHANAVALRKVLEDAQSVGVDKVVCLGDVVGYGPMPVKALSLVRKNAAIVLAGNHDEAVAGKIDAADFIGLAGDAVRRHRKALGRADLEWLKGLSHVAAFEGAVAVHGDFTDPKSFLYIENEADAEANFAAVDGQLLFVGHTHVPAIFVTGASGAAHRLDAQDFTLENGKRYIVNPGSVGYPRESDGTCFSSYVVYDTEAETVTFRRVPFLVSSVMQRGGTDGRRWRAWTLGALAVALVVGAAVGLALTRRQEPTVPPPVAVAVKEPEVPPQTPDAALVVAERSLTIGKSARNVRANLKLDPAGGPVRLRLLFKSADGKKCGETVLTVKRSSRQKFAIQGDAVSVNIAAMKPTQDSSPRILSFNPMTGR